MTPSVTPYVPTRGERLAAIRHVVYEYRNLLLAAHYSLYGAAPWRTHCDDAFLLGCRKIEDFLVRKNRTVPCNGTTEMDDILALDYLPDGTTITWALPLWKKKWKYPMNKQLAHLAYDRDKEWNHLLWVPQLRDEFTAAWNAFQNAITDQEYRERFNELLNGQ